MQFEWDEPKAEANRRKHGVSFEEAATVFADPYALTDPDQTHSHREDRETTIGLTTKNRVIVVVTTERGNVIRVISARRATRSEVKRYEEEVQKINRGGR